MTYCYLFEAKSIQTYLFSSGRLVDIIAASERLDKLIDSSETSLLGQVLNTLGLTHDIDDADQGQCDIHFLRCKGGAFYAYSHKQETINQLRSLWTLTLQQAFPSLLFADALANGDTLRQALDKGFKALNSSKNNPTPRAHVATAPLERHPRTGQAAMTPSALAQRASKNERIGSRTATDIDTDLHRQADYALAIRQSSDLQQRFTPDDAGDVQYLYDLEHDFEGNDIALIHVDGNGLGQLLQSLRQLLNDSSEEEYRKVFRAFSEAINSATIVAAKHATQALINASAADIIPIRPIVLGGDDLTLLCDAAHAMRYTENFILMFEAETEQRLKAVFAQLQQSDKQKLQQLPQRLTASGGIAYHKASHPYVQTSALVESLTAAAKNVDRTQSHISFCRVSNTLADDYQNYIDRAQRFTLADGQRMTVAQPAYRVQPDQSQSITALRALARVSSKTNAPVSMNRWRKMLAELAKGNRYEAQRIYERGFELSKTSAIEFEPLIQQVINVNSSSTFKHWFSDDGAGNYYSPIADLLTLAHFEPQQGSDNDVDA